ncbi:MAG: NlpC/P60 family protein [Amphritea sp.]
MRVLLIVTVVFLLSACGSQSVRHNRASISDSTDLSNTAMVRDQLLQHYKEWQGVPYKLGGNSKQGIDCSGFTQTVFNTRFGMSIPSSTELQSSIGDAVPKRLLLPGDLVFFKTEVKVRHVGVYLGNNEFLHASTSRGVMVSKLDNIYWNSRYWKAKRINGL